MPERRPHSIRPNLIAEYEAMKAMGSQAVSPYMEEVADGLITMLQDLEEQLEAALRIVDAARRARDNGDFRVRVDTANIALGLAEYDERYPAPERQDA